MENRLFSNKQLIKLIIPLAIEQGLTILVGMADGVMVSSVGEAAISGVSLVDMIAAVILVLFAALATGGSVVTSQFLGACNLDKARRSVGQLVSMAIVLSVLIMIPCMIWAEEMLMLCFGAIEPDVKEAGLLYLRITALSFPFIALYNAGAAILRSSGNSKASMQVSLVMNIINVVGNYVCIFILGMDVEGVAIPTLISRAVAGIAMVAMISGPKQELRLTVRGMTQLDKTMMGSILRIGVPSACENCFFSLGRLVVASMITLFGTAQVSANAVAGNIDRMGIIMGQAMGLAIVTVVGQSIGAQDKEQAKYYVKKLLIWAYVIQGISNLLILLFVKQLAGLYELSGESMALAIKLSTMHSSMAILFWPMSFVLPNALRAASDVRYTMWVGIGSMLMFRIIGSWVLCVYMGMGAVGVWIAMISDWVCRTIFFVARTMSGKWLTKYMPA